MPPPNCSNAAPVSFISSMRSAGTTVRMPTPPPDDPDDKKTFTAAKLKTAKKALDDAEKLPEKTDKEQRIKARIVRQTTHAHEQAKKANDHAIKFSEDFEKKKKEREVL